MVLTPTKYARNRFPTLGRSEHAIFLVLWRPARRLFFPFSSLSWRVCEWW